MIGSGYLAITLAFSFEGIRALHNRIFNRDLTQFNRDSKNTITLAKNT